MEKQGLKTKENSMFVEIDAAKVDFDLISRVLDTKSNGVLALYDYFLDKGIIKTVRPQ